MLVAVNESLAVYAKDAPYTRTVGPVGLTSFFKTPTSTFDPRALYDAGSGRFVLLAVTSDSRGKTASFTLAVSQNNNPRSASTGWCTYKLNAVTGIGGSAAWADFPGLGMDGNNLYLTSNQFTFNRNTFQFARLLVVPKSSVYPDAVTGTCKTASSTDFRSLRNPDGTAAFTVQPANQPDALPGQTSPMYLVNAEWASWSQRMALRSVSTQSGLSLGAPSWFTVSYYDMPADAPQPSGGAIDTGDTRLLGATDRYGAIYTSNTSKTVGGDIILAGNPNPYAAARWYKLVPGSAAAENHAVADANVAFFFPSVLPGCTPDPLGVSGCVPFTALQASGSGASQPASAFAVQETGSPAIASAYATGVGGYSLNSRWGDYSAISSDPTAPGSVWVTGEYAQAGNAWGTAVAQVTSTQVTP